MSDLWYSFDPLDADERAEQQILETEIATIEWTALDAIRRLVALVDRSGLPAETGGKAALTHIATLAQAESQRMFRQSIERADLRRERLAR